MPRDSWLFTLGHHPLGCDTGAPYWPSSPLPVTFLSILIKHSERKSYQLSFPSPGSTGTATVSRVKGLFTMSLDLAAKLSALKVSK